MTAPDPLLAAGNATVRRTLAEMRQTVADFPPEALNWKPAGDGTNSVAVLATHSLHSTRSWLCTALGEPLPDRDRDAEFRVAEDDPGALVSFFDDIASQCSALLASPREVDWAAIRRTHTRPDASDEIQVPAAWALLHAIEHLREHLGQMQLTRQLCDQKANLQTSKPANQ
jgi:uncharacterized damage-inducible protein DinB